MLILKNLSKNYGSKSVLKNVNYTFEEGKVYGVIGDNGAGKTTLFKSIAGLEKYQGTITYTKGILKHTLGYLATELYFFDQLTGREYIHLLQVARSQKAVIHETANIFDLPLEAYVSTYSTGMKKKLAFLAILLQKNNFFILDEPFNGVDFQSNLILTELIIALKKKQKTILLSSHIFKTLSAVCDEILILKDGTFKRTIKKEDFSSFEAEITLQTSQKLQDFF